MTKNTKIQLGIIIGAIAAIGAELLGETGNTPTPETVTADPPAGEAPKRRGRPAAEKPAAETPAPETPTPTPPVVGKTIDELRALYRPIVEEGRGDEVKAIMKKHGANSVAELAPEKHADFIKDIEALSL